SQNGALIDGDLTDNKGTYYIHDLAAGTYLEEVRDGRGNLLATKNITVLGDQGTNFIDFVLPNLPASVILDSASLAQTYDGTQKRVLATTIPFGLTVSLTYNGSPTAPTSAGTYVVTGIVTDPLYVGTTSGTLIVAKVTPTITWPPPAPIS